MANHFSFKFCPIFGSISFQFGLICVPVFYKLFPIPVQFSVLISSKFYPIFTQIWFWLLVTHFPTGFKSHFGKFGPISATFSQFPREYLDHFPIDFWCFGGIGQLKSALKPIFRPILTQISQFPTNFWGFNDDSSLFPTASGPTSNDSDEIADWLTVFKRWANELNQKSVTNQREGNKPIEIEFNELDQWLWH